MLACCMFECSGREREGSFGVCHARSSCDYTMDEKALLRLLQPDADLCLQGGPLLPRVLSLPVKAQLQLLSDIDSSLSAPGPEWVQLLALQVAGLLAQHHAGPWSAMVQACAAMLVRKASHQQAQSSAQSR